MLGKETALCCSAKCRGSSASILKEKLSSMDSSGILADHHLQVKLQEQHMKGQSRLTISDIARKAFLYSHFMEGHAKIAPISRLPLITIMDSKNKLKDIPVFQLNFFNKENRVLHYPVGAFYVDGMNIMAYNLCSGAHKEVQTKWSFIGKIMISSSQTEKGSTIQGCDAAFIGPNDNKFAILDEYNSGMALYILPGAALQEANDKIGAYEPNLLPDEPVDAKANSVQGPIPFMFDTEVGRIFSTSIESTLMFACNGKQIGLTKLFQGSWLPNSDGHYISTKTEGKKYVRLNANEIVLQVHWQQTLRGYAAGVLTTQRVLIVSADIDVLASNSSKFDKGNLSWLEEKGENTRKNWGKKREC
ncbi:hypothetical protein F3Y22_tig00000329pilonHSYRG00242 [Hibiscus syriacus]|uniref:Uncharacterized protein n=1 Tax=Hibiscus syriacus TaxID=106335 RepID=A0A6A3D277_HIBSY|nr:hypothetical protein F3Y22_tig00000329pilonHSYRG00242 [Hibiscus syriacus]